MMTRAAPQPSDPAVDLYIAIDRYWRLGMDTQRIADAMGLAESVVYNVHALGPSWLRRL